MYFIKQNYLTTSEVYEGDRSDNPSKNTHHQDGDLFI